MPESTLRLRETDDSTDFLPPMDAAPMNASMVLVVARTPISRIVVTRIAERCGLRAIDGEPEAARDLLDRHQPATVILDGGAGNHECDALIPHLLDLKRASATGLPSVILLSNSNRTPEEFHGGAAIDAVVAKPITPEGLQPTILRLVDRMRSLS